MELIDAEGARRNVEQYRASAGASAWVLMSDIARGITTDILEDVARESKRGNWETTSEVLDEMRNSIVLDEIIDYLKISGFRVELLDTDFRNDVQIRVMW